MPLDKLIHKNGLPKMITIWTKAPVRLHFLTVAFRLRLLNMNR